MSFRGHKGPHEELREELIKKYGGVFEPSYITLRSFVSVGGLESDLRLLAPGEFCANTTGPVCDGR